MASSADHPPDRPLVEDPALGGERHRVVGRLDQQRRAPGERVAPAMPARAAMAPSAPAARRCLRPDQTDVGRLVGVPHDADIYSRVCSIMPAMPRGRTSSTAMMNRNCVISTYCPPRSDRRERLDQPISMAAISAPADAAQAAGQRHDHAFDQRRGAGIRADEIVLRQQHRGQSGHRAGHHHHRHRGRAQADADQRRALGVLHHGADFQAAPAALHPDQHDQQQDRRADDGADLVMARDRGADMKAADSRRSSAAPSRAARRPRAGIARPSG